MLVLTVLVRCTAHRSTDVWSLHCTTVQFWTWLLMWC